MAEGIHAIFFLIYASSPARSPPMHEVPGRVGGWGNDSSGLASNGSRVAMHFSQLWGAVRFHISFLLFLSALRRDSIAPLNSSGSH